ncbi:MAG: family 20 glycosylhydrolase [Planctomycetota bacterium]|nr:family 20 glycosylhydrolase [Planctomycetota bacterium]
MRTITILASCVLSFCAAGALGADPSEKYPGLNLLPWPKSVTVEAGHMTLTAASRIVAAQGPLKPLAEILAGEIAQTTGLKLAVVSGEARAGDVVLTINNLLKADEPIRVLKDRQAAYTTDGAGRITVTDRAVVEGFDYRATAEGTSTLLQAIDQAGGGVRLPRVTIKDWPHADYCAVMLDVGRQWHPIEAVKQVVQLCRLYRARYLHLHLTDDQGWTFPSTKYPQLGTKNGGAHGGQAPKVYTVAELKDLVAYADARGVTVVPEIEIPGHSGAALRSFPEAFDAINPDTGQPQHLGCMNMANEALYGVLDTIIGEACEIFRSSPYFHIGTDECSSGRLQLYSGYKAFLAKHGLKSDGELADHFIRQVNAMVAKRGKKAIKWEGLANGASKDIIIMTWDSNARTAERVLAAGYLTITCPWNLGVPWEEWNMYICNGSHCKRTDSVMGATLVMWEQSPCDQVAILRDGIPRRQERTWGPDNQFTAAGWGKRYNATDALAGRLLGIETALRWPVRFETTLPSRGLQSPAMAIDNWAAMYSWGNTDRDMATWFLSAAPAKKGDHFTLRFDPPVQALAVEACTGTPDGQGVLRGLLQTSADGATFKTVATFDEKGLARADLTDNTVKALRLLADADGTGPLAVRDIRLKQMVEISKIVVSPNTEIGPGKVAVAVADAGFGYATGQTAVPVVNRGFTFTFHSGGGNAMGFLGSLSGTGKVEVYQGSVSNFRDSPLTLGGAEPNSFRGTWLVKSGRVTLAKPAGVDALAGEIVVGGQGDNDCLFWAAPDQINDQAAVSLLDSPHGAATLQLNGFNESFATLTLMSKSCVATDNPAGQSGVLTVKALVMDGKSLARGVYAGGRPWIKGGGYVGVGSVKYVAVEGALADVAQTVGAGNFGVLKAPANVTLAGGPCGIPFDTKTFDLTLAGGGQPVTYEGFLCGQGGVTFDAASPIELAGPAANSYKGLTRLTTGTLRLNKPAGVIAIPGHLALGSAGGKAPVAVVWGGDGQISAKADVTVQGDGPVSLNLAGHKQALGSVALPASGRISPGPGGALTVRRLSIGGKPVPPGAYSDGQGWLAGPGTVTVDPRVDVAGSIPGPTGEIGAGNVANLTGDTVFSYGTGACDIDVITNGHKFTLDSGDGNPLCYSGVISGTGDVFFRMGPTHTGYKDAPLRLAGEKPNTAGGVYHVAKGRVQPEKPDGVDAIAGDVIVGGQGFNDCLFWLHGNQIKDSATLTLIESPNSGASYLCLNGQKETVAALAVNGACRVVTDGPGGAGGELTVKALTVKGKALPAGTYTAADQKWIEGAGRVIVKP